MGTPLPLMLLRCGPPFTIDAFEVWTPLYYYVVEYIFVERFNSKDETFDSGSRYLQFEMFYSFILQLGNNLKSTVKSHRIYDSKLALTTMNRCKTKLSLLMGFA